MESLDSWESIYRCAASMYNPSINTTYSELYTEYLCMLISRFTQLNQFNVTNTNVVLPEIIVHQYDKKTQFLNIYISIPLLAQYINLPTLKTCEKPKEIKNFDLFDDILPEKIISTNSKYDYIIINQLVKCILIIRHWLYHYHKKIPFDGSHPNYDRIENAK